MDAEVAIRVFPPTASAAEDQQVTVWLLGGAPPFMLDPQPPEGGRVTTAGTGRTWCLRIRGGAAGSIGLVARDFAGGFATASIELLEGRADSEAPPAPGERLA